MSDLPRLAIQMNIQIDPEFRQLIPALRPDEYQQLETNLITDGCRDPLVLWNDTLIDGHNRYEICQKHNLDFSTVQRDFEDRHSAKLWMLDNQLGRRNLPDPIRIKLAYQMKETEAAKALERKRLNGGDKKSDMSKLATPILDTGSTREKLAGKAQVSNGKYAQGEYILTKAPEWIQKLWTEQTISTNRAYELTQILEKTHNDVCACVEFYALTEPDTIVILIRLHKNQADTWRVICETGWIQPGDEHEAVHVTDSPVKIQKALDILAKSHKQIAMDNRKLEIKAQEELAKIGLKDISLWTMTDNQSIVSCDVLITDPPYGILDEVWEPDNLKEFTCEWAARWNNSGADFMLIFWSQAHLWNGRNWFDNAFSDYSFQQLLIWHYPNNKKPQSRMLFKQTWEPILFYRRNGCKRQVINSAAEWGNEFTEFDCHTAAIPQTNYNDVDFKQHPAQKPLSVMLWLINATTQVGELVCDPFAGSGTTGIAATKLGRKFHGIENSPEYLELATRRLAKYGQQHL